MQMKAPQQRKPSQTAAKPAPAARLHPRNRHQGRYDMARLLAANPALKGYLVRTPAGTDSIDFSNPAGVRELNRALLASDYGIQQWDIPDGYLCPPVPGRVDYLHGLADLLAADNGGTIPRGPGVRALDIGVGANCIYPLLGQAEYGWRFLGSDIDTGVLQAADANVQANHLGERIALRLQPARGNLFAGLLQADERFELTLCNPPFHASAKEAAQGSQRKLRNLGGTQARASKAPALNFGGQANELWCTGGEASFLRRMIRESVDIQQQVLWFSSLVAKSEHLADIRKQLGKAGAAEVREVAMAQGNKQSRFVAWSFHSATARKDWLQQAQA
ncbi:23S rRNA (adenine(1618)-N(6))-methyltransferase RlmF [Stenotrophomonas sp.]|uniref:23S rRNA (adenine(1618)-N(6))-methyltransferase RlmF n=1 Tax=Stenotrophomonas sp. TaxID=69392 RepID=UPI0028B08AC9|nr:23S rRNA (adenine(1618)-N(6))-methyltransferase RlmF [Stenotrophomonas sp.]